MPFNKTSYETTSGLITSNKKLEVALKESLVCGLQNMSFGVSPLGDTHAVYVSGVSSDETNIPPFIHPYLIENFKGKSYLVTDIRAFRNNSSPYQNQQEFENSVRNKTEYALVKNRSIIELHWVAEDPAKMRTRFSFAGNVFAAWISQSVSKAYALDFHDQFKIMAVAIYYWHSLFTQETKLKDRLLENAVFHAAKVTKLPAEEIHLIFEKIPEIHSVNELCIAIQESVENIRLRDFNVVMLMTLVRNTWYGVNAKELIAVALEYPPAWISIVFAALTEKTYRSSPVYRIIEAQAKRANAEEFKMNFLDTIRRVAYAVETIDEGEELVIRDYD